MFFHTYILTKRGPFAKVWLAAHWDRKLTKQDIQLIDLSETVLNIVEPTVPIALRTSGELMLGVVRIYGHKVRVLLKEAQEAVNSLLRNQKDLENLFSGSSGRMAVTKEIPSMVTYMDGQMDFMASSIGSFDADFDAIASIVLPDTVDKGLRTIPRVSQHDDLSEDWFQPPASQIYEYFDDFAQNQQFKTPLGNSDFRREGSIQLSEHSKKSSSVPSIEELRKSSTGQRNTEFGQLNMEVGLPLPEADFSKFPDLPVTPSFPRETGIERGFPQTPIPGILTEPLHKKRNFGTRANIIDEKETVLSSEIYRNLMCNRSELLNLFHHQGPTNIDDAYRAHRLSSNLNDLDLLGELRGWDIAQSKFTAVIQELYPKTLPSAEAVFGAEPTQLIDETMSESPFGSRRETGLTPQPLFDDPHTPSDVIDDFMLSSSGSGKSNNKLNTTDLTMSALKSEVSTKGKIMFQNSMIGKTRAQVARSFSDTLELVMQGQIHVRQDVPFGDILVTVVA